MSRIFFAGKSIQVSAILLFVVDQIACNSYKTKPVNDNMVKGICITSSGGMRGNRYALSIDSSLNYFYQETGWFTDSTGIFYAKVTQEFWDTMNSRINKIPLKEFDTNYGDGNIDCSDFVVLLTYRNKKKQINFNSCGRPEDLIDLVYYIKKYQKTIKLTPCFEITSKRPPPPPKPLINELKVIPPDLDSSGHR